ncbi:hypothetical protein C823_005401 [Eubacterium plexicaudatum ASF492]|nr:hypothetical protein C823_005401 [Eubacterium plexicaudatum ASF492]
MRNREIDRIYDWSVQQKGSYDYPQMDKNAKVILICMKGIPI